MPRFSEEWISELLSKVNLVELIGEYVTLQFKSGRYWGCCPFHNEKTPSFTVNPQKGFYHCFGCHKGGNAIQFMMEHEKMTFPEACSHLAEKVRLTIPEMSDNREYERKKKEREIVCNMNRFAARFFHQQLWTQQGADALAYLRRRGLNDAAIKTFGLGFAPDSWDALMNQLCAAGFSQNDMRISGLIKFGEGSKMYDMFRNRAIMPIIGLQGDVIGFGGRVMGEGEPKYLNSPETPAFNKSRNLYNLNQIKKLRDLKYLILAEGYMDVIALHLHGLPECVATLGTALTPDQARIIKRYTSRVYLSYDGDDAGQKATLRALDICAREGLEPRVVVIPGGQDPDEFLKKYGRGGYTELMKRALPPLDYKFASIALRYDMNETEQKEAYARECVALIKQEQSAMVREKYIKMLAKQTGFSVQAVAQDAAPQMQPEMVVPETLPPPADLRAERSLIRVLCENPALIRSVEGSLRGEDLQDAVHRKIFFAVLDAVKKGITPTGGELLSVLTDEQERAYATQLLDEDTGDVVEGVSEAFFVDCLNRVKIATLEGERAILQQRYQAEQDSPKRMQWMQRMSEIAKEIQQRKQKF